ncbi:hypothetical protein QJS04_geneDACA009820 [Acorus gramineus]|uniref:PRLI-interacting factor A n=1 Tax=Acorus gramineus TaxID=55184 RepID=A0AAV9BDJ3_ACOGR|nr:hypothetical protein QJS04_geneDACA009820 [Acorus gramineus]
MNDLSQIMNRTYPHWQQPMPPQSQQPPLLPQAPAEDPVHFLNPQRMGFVPGAGASGKPARGVWKGKKFADKRKKPSLSSAVATGGGVSGGVYQPPRLQDLQFQNRVKARRFYPKKKFQNRFAPFAPRNTTSFIIRAKKSGGIASLVSPCPVTPAILPTPTFSPSREVLGDMAKEEWGVDGYGSMKGLIRLRTNPEAGAGADDEAEDDGSSESDVEEHVEVERRLDHDLSRFEMIHPGGGFADEHAYLLENRVDDQDTHIAQLEEENLTLKERLFLMEQEMADLRRRLQSLETESGRGGAEREENVEDNHLVEEEESDNEGATGDVCSEKSVSG